MERFVEVGALGSVRGARGKISKVIHRCGVREHGDLAQNPSKMLKCQGVYLEECPGFAQNPKFSIKMCFSPENTMA